MKQLTNHFLILLLVFSLLLSFVSCSLGNGSQDSSSQKESESEEKEYPEDPTYVSNPLGKGIGVNPGRVVWAYDEYAFDWDGTGAWWNNDNYSQRLVYEMLENALCDLAGKDNIEDAMDALFRDFNLRTYGEARGYTQGEKIAIKGNMNATNQTAEDKTSGNCGYFPAPYTVQSLLKILVRCGVDPTDITFYDTSRSVPDCIRSICTTGELYGVNIVSYFADESVVDTTKPIQWSHDLKTDGWLDYDGYPTVNPTYFPKFVTEATYMINLFNLRGHTLAGFTASAKNHYGSIMPGYTDPVTGAISFPENFRKNPPTWAGVHHYIAAQDYFSTPVEIWHLPKVEMGSYTTLVDLMGNKDCGGKTFLYLCDALAATVHQGSYMSLNEKWYTFGYDGEKAWTNSLFVSQDPVAIDSVCYDFILAEQAAAMAHGETKWDMVLPEGNTAENYLIEAALCDSAPSGTEYKDGYGKKLSSLGVHEHWNNAEEKYYSRNLGYEEGIELIKVTK